jgi:uncharacterized protein with NRDE domain
VCTLIAAFQCFPDWPLVVAANRDERLDRPASGPKIWREKVRFIAPRDDAAGGSWLGLNEHGLWVAVTNRFGVARDERRSSRGALVVEGLQSPDAASLHRKLGGLAPGRFNAFHLFYADARNAFVTWSDGERIAQQSVEKGVQIITERSLGGDDRRRTELIRERWKQVEQGPGPLAERLAHILRIHSEDPVAGTCVHVPAFNYGTRSSAILLLGAPLGRTEFLWAPGSPCVAPYAPQTGLISELLGEGHRS